MHWIAAVAFPWYDPITNKQYFPYKTMAMLIGLGLMLAVAYLTDWAMDTGRMSLRWLKIINNRVGKTAVSTKGDDEDSASSAEEMKEVTMDLMSNEHKSNNEKIA